jgi:hypothetical protein
MLFKFQALSNRKLWYIPALMLLGFSTDIFRIIQKIDFDLDSQISNTFVLWLLLWAPYSKRFPGIHPLAGMSTQFLVSRAVDRNILYRSTLALLYFVILAVPFAIFLFALKKPDLEVYLYSGISPDLCLSHVPGSSLVTTHTGHDRPLIFIPNGNPLIAAWHLWAFLVGMLGMQFLSLIPYHKLRWLKISPFVWKSFFGILLGLLLSVFGILVGLLFGLLCIVVILASLSYNNHLFYSFAAHQTAFWIVTVPMLIVGQFLCERRFARME